MGISSALAMAITRLRAAGGIRSPRIPVANGSASRRPGSRVTMRVMDFYRCELAEDGDGNRDSIRENWVPIDIPHILFQLGVDVFGRMRHQFRQTGAISASEFLVGG